MSREGPEEKRPQLVVHYGEGDLPASQPTIAIKTTEDVTINPADDAWLGAQASHGDTKTLTVAGGDAPKEAYLAFDLQRA